MVNKDGGKRNWKLDNPDGFLAELSTTLVPQRSVAAPTFTRATTATVEDFEGLIKTAISGEARFKGARRVENLLTYTEDFSNGAWANAGVVITSGQSDPMGGTNAYKIVLDDSGDNLKQSIAAAGLGIGSIWIKGDSGSDVTLGVKIDATGNSITGITTEWQRFDTGTVADMNRMQIGDRVGTFYIFGAQLEQGSFATSYIPTEATAVTRNADILSYPSSGIIDDTVGAMSAEFTTNWTDETLSAIGKLLTDDTESPLLINTDRTLGAVDGTNTHTGDAITGTAALQKMASNWGASEMNTFLNGVAGTDSTFDDDFDLGATLGVGSNSDGTLSLFGTLKNLKIWKRKLPNNLLVGYTG